MTIALCGGGSGGHITPLLAVARELRRLKPEAKIVYIGEKNGKFSHIAENSDVFDELHFVYAGKLRRYHGESWLKQAGDIKTVTLNIRDIFFIALGTFQSWLLLRRMQPSSLLLKGGYVCVPVALAAKHKRIPYITHDSDALPGLSNRIAARWAKVHATAMPAHFYKYPAETVRPVGVPIDSRFKPVTDKQRESLREEMGYSPDDLILFVTGGSNGARRLNKAVIGIMPDLFNAHPRLKVIHHIGEGNQDQYSSLPDEYKSRVTTFDFSRELYKYSAVSDVIVTRAGATTLAEFASQKKACVIVPNPYLTGGHQLRNAEVYQEMGAALVVPESTSVQTHRVLLQVIDQLLRNSKNRKMLEEAVHATVPKQDAAKALAELIVEITGQ
jgi:UDP-N-acetylglucosamine--N-acetylmuramyl-(pentapeptide) pyrophosphoryl-undecaprenol N-acetylglucosamine transferase